MIKFENIIKRFGDITVLDDVSGEFYDGQINMLVGPSGTGKSVLFKCILGLVPVDSGRIFFDDKEMIFSESANNEHGYQNGIGMLPQNPTLFSEKTVEENVMFPLDILTNLSNEEKKELVNKSLEQVGLIDCNNKYPHDLSGGMQKKVGLARAIVHKPKYLFCDEPNSGLDPLNSQKIDELIKKISKEYDTTTVIVTHNLDSIIDIGNHVMFLYKSKKFWDGDVKDIFNTKVPEFEEFLQSSSMFQKYKKTLTKK